MDSRNAAHILPDASRRGERRRLGDTAGDDETLRTQRTAQREISVLRKALFALRLGCAALPSEGVTKIKNQYSEAGI